MRTQIYGILLAAGEARRMGFPKQLLPIAGEAAIARVVRAMRPAVAELIIVIGAYAAQVRAALPSDVDCRVVENANYDRGQLSSLKVGLAALPETAAAALVHLVDHPLVEAATFEQLINVYRESGKAIVIARYNGRRGHPVVFDRAVFHELRGAPEGKGARVVVEADALRVAYGETRDRGIAIDLDTPEDVTRAGLTMPGKAGLR